MTDRTVKVTLLLAAQGYMSGMDSVARKTAETGSEIEKLNQKKQAFQALGAAALGFGTVAAAGIAFAISRFAEFDEQMSSVQAATHETSANMALLRQAALDAGESTVYSATEAAGAIEELAKAGVSTSDILAGALAGSLDLAAAGQLGVARAAEITSTALNQYGLAGDQAAHVADVLAAGAGKAMGSVEDLSNGLKFVGPVAASMGVSLEQTTGVLALFAQQGIIGEQAGTSLRGVLASLTSPSATARKEIERLGLQLYDSQGNFLGLENAAGQLANAYNHMDGASRDASMGIIFGRETVTAATALYKAGAGGVNDWTKAVDDSGFAAQTARDRLDNLKGDVEALGGAFDTALIQTGSGANDVLRQMVQMVSVLVDGYNDLPQPVQTATLLIAAAAAAVALTGGAALVAVPKWAEFKSTVAATGLSMGKIALQGAGVGAALAVATAAIGSLVAKQAEMRAGAEEFADSLDKSTGAVTEYTRQIIAKKLADAGAFDGAREAGVSQRELTDALYEGGDAYSQVMSRLREAHAASGGWNATIGNSINAVKDMNVQLGDASERHRDMKSAGEGSAGAMGANAESTATAATAYMEASSQANQLQNSLNDLIDAIGKANGIGQDAISKNIDYQNALRDVDETIRQAREGVEGYTLTLDQGTQAGRDNMDMLVSLAQEAQGAASAQFQLDGNTAAYKSTLEASRQALVDRAQQLGMNSEQAGALADQIFRIPSETEWKVIAETRDAQGDVNRFITDNAGRQIPLRITAEGISSIRLPNGMTASSNASGNLYVGGKAKNFAAGGWASGIYPATPGGIHRFAEAGHDEAYITMDPQYRARSRKIWGDVGDRLGLWESNAMPAGRWASAPASAGIAPQVATSIVGATLSGTLDLGDGLTGMIRGQIVAAQEADARTAARGVVKR